MTTLRDALTLAVGHHGRGEHADAAAIYRLILAVQPDNAAALNNLGLLSEPPDAMGLFRRAMAADPAYLDAALNLGGLLQESGATDQALAVYCQALQWLPEDPDLHFRAGYALQNGGHAAEAAEHYQAALATRPDFVPALCNLGTLHTVAEQYESAARYYEKALAIDPALIVANMNMVGILEAQGRLADADRHRTQVPCPQDIAIHEPASPRRTVLVLAGSKGNVPLDGLLPPDTRRITWHVEYATDAQEAALPAYDVVFNGIGNADTMAASQTRVAGMHRRRPVLNPPEKVARTRRDLLPQLLHGIPGVVVPRVVRLSGHDLRGPTLPESLAEHGMGCPVLIRPIVGHGGNGMVLADTLDDLAGLAAEADAYYAIAFHDYRSADGFYRKYRAIFVDREVFPYHLAISQAWLVHYFSAGMLDGAWKRKEERRFLEDPAAAIGVAAMAALSAIARRLDLDFAGIDFSLLPDGRLLVFEANPTMLVHMSDPADEFPYKHVAVPKITAAFAAMLDRQAASSPADKHTMTFERLWFKEAGHELAGNSAAVSG